MIMSGIGLTAMMKNTMKGGAVGSKPENQQKLAHEFNYWVGMFTHKFFISLMMTPFVDKFLLLAISFANGKYKEKTLEPSDNMKAVLKLYKLMIMFVIYVYSAIIRKFREDRKDFTDKEEFAKIIDNMINNLN